MYMSVRKQTAVGAVQPRATKFIQIGKIGSGTKKLLSKNYYNWVSICRAINTKRMHS